MLHPPTSELNPRQLIVVIAHWTNSTLLPNFVGYGNGVTFQIAIGAPVADSRAGFAIRTIRDRDLERWGWGGSGDALCH
jgi:hypothetical protein